MKKDLIFTPILFAIGIALFLLRTTGMMAHMVISVVGLVVLVVYTILTKNEWKVPAVEVIMRAFYGIALISGIVIKAVHGVAALSTIHKVSGTLFVALIIVSFVYKLATNKKVEK